MRFPWVPLDSQWNTIVSYIFPIESYGLLWAPAAAGINFRMTVRNITVGAIGERYSIAGHPLGWPGKNNNLMFLNKEFVSEGGRTQNRILLDCCAFLWIPKNSCNSYGFFCIPNGILLFRTYFLLNHMDSCGRLRSRELVSELRCGISLSVQFGSVIRSWATP